MIKILYKTKKIKNICEDTKCAIREIGADPGKKLSKLINAIMSAQDLQDIAAMPQYRLHQLKGNKNKIYSISVYNTGYRIEFYPMDENKNIIVSGENENKMFRQTKYIEIIEISKHYGQ